MKILKIVFFSIIITLVFILLLIKFSRFNINDSIFLGVGTVLLTYLVPEIYKVFRQKKDK